MAGFKEYARIFITQRVNLTVGVLASLIAAVIVGWWQFSVGYDDGYKMGLLDSATQAALASRAKIEEDRKQQYAALAIELDRKREEHAAQLEEQVRKRFQDELVSAANRGQQAGVEIGRIEGERNGQQMCVRDCERKLIEFDQTGMLWNTFQAYVSEAVRSTSDTDNDFQLQVGTILKVVDLGKEALTGLQSELGGDVEELAKAVEASDYKKAKDVLKVINNTIEVRRRNWSAHFTNLSLGFRLR